MAGTIVYSRVPGSKGRTIHTEVAAMKVLDALHKDDLLQLQASHKVVARYDSKISLGDRKYIAKGMEITVLCDDDVLIQNMIDSVEKSSEKTENSEKN